MVSRSSSSVHETNVTNHNFAATLSMALQRSLVNVEPFMHPQKLTYARPPDPSQRLSPRNLSNSLTHALPYSSGIPLSPCPCVEAVPPVGAAVDVG